MTLGFNKPDGVPAEIGQLTSLEEVAPQRAIS